MIHTRTIRIAARGVWLLAVSLNLAFVATGAGATPTPIFPENTITLSVDSANNTASGILHLHNDTDQELTISLTAGDFISQNTKKGLNAKVVFLGPTDTTGHVILQAPVPKKSRLPVRIEVTNLWEAGESVATLYDHGDAIGTIKVLKYRPPFNVKLVTSSNDKPELSFSKGKPQQLTLRNDDGMTYTVHPTIAVDGNVWECKDQTVILSPNSSSVMTVAPLDSWFTPAGFVREETREGTLTLAFHPEGSTSDPGWPVKVIPFKARLSRTPAFWLEFFSYIFIFLLLLAGGICSLLLGNWVPNQLARAKLKARLGQLAERMRGL